MNILKSIAGGIAALTLGSVAYAEELKLAHFGSTKYPLHVQVFVPFAEEFGAATGGATTMRVYPGGELGKGPAKQYDRVLDGVADVVYALPGYTASQFKKTLLVELPGVIPEGSDFTGEVWEDIAMLDDEFQRTKLLALWTSSPGMLLMAEKKIESLDDLAGLKIRVPSKNTGLVVEAWGATAVSMPITQVYQSMETGVVDGVLVDPSVLSSFKLGEVTKYITRGMTGTNSMFMLVMNRDSWDGLDADTQAKLEGLTGLERSMAGNATMAGDGVSALEKWVAAGGEVVDLSADAAAAFNDASAGLAAEVIAELEADGVNAQAWADALKD